MLPSAATGPTYTPPSSPPLLARLKHALGRRNPSPISSSGKDRSESILDVVQFHVISAVARLETSLSPSLTLRRLRSHPFDWRTDGHWIFLAVLSLVNLCYITSPTWPLRLFIGLLFITLLLVPLTSQFFFPASPIFAWLLLFYSCRFIPSSIRPHIWVSVLPTLESVLYGANISDVLTRYTSPVLDILAWLPYGVIHFGAPFVCAGCLFVFGPSVAVSSSSLPPNSEPRNRPGAVKFFGKAFGYMNLIGVFIQILFPCSPPCPFSSSLVLHV
jgi:hypothetical protein